MTAPLSLAELRRVDLFTELDDGQLALWLEAAQVHEVPAGTIIAELGEPTPGMQLLLEGTVRNLMVDHGRVEPVGHQLAPTWIGAIASITDGRTAVRMLAETACRVAIVVPEDFRRLALSQPTVHRRVMRQIAPVMSRITAVEQSRERLASLGTMAAGLAHELNNPAAAARRAAAQMAEALDVLGATLGHFVEAGIERSDAQELVGLQREALARAEGLTALGALDASDAEDALLERLQELGVSDAWKLSEPLAAAGVDEQWLAKVAAHAGRGLDPALDWVAASLTARGLAAELQESAKRMSELVGAVKSYAYMDRGELVEVDLHEGLETTLTVLAHKLKGTTIALVRDYDRTLPRLTVRGSELNQVWTNLIDNAIEALGQSGTITVSTRREGAYVIVEIADDGPGIPPEIQGRIFDSFFTTKDVGVGTGLGLATARRIVADRHDGSLAVQSEPGATVFSVSLPIP
jgi:signal transduction histidine kinase